MEDSKGFKADPVTLTVRIHIIRSSEEEQEEDDDDQKLLGFVPDWDKFYADQKNGLHGQDDD